MSRWAEAKSVWSGRRSLRFRRPYLPTVIPTEAKRSGGIVALRHPLVHDDPSAGSG